MRMLFMAALGICIFVVCMYMFPTVTESLDDMKTSANLTPYSGMEEIADLSPLFIFFGILVVIGMAVLGKNKLGGGKGGE